MTVAPSCHELSTFDKGADDNGIFSPGSMDPYQRAPRSPRGKKPQNAEGVGQNSEESKSPTTDQVCHREGLNWI